MVNQTIKGYGLLLLTITLFSTYEVIGRMFAQTVPPLLVSAIRFSLGGVVLLPFAITSVRRRQLKLTARDFAALLGLGLLIAGVSMGLLQFSLRYIEASTSAVLFSSNPLLVMVLSTVALGEPVTKRKVISLALGVAGMVFVAGGLTLDSGFGAMLAVGASVAWAVYTVAGKQMAARFGSLALNGLSFTLGGGVLLVVSLAFSREPVVISPTNWLLLAYLGVFVTGIAYYAFFAGLAYTDTTLGSAVFFFKPVLASIFAYFLLGENLTPGKVTGIALILVAMLLVLTPLRPGSSHAKTMRPASCPREKKL